MSGRVYGIDLGTTYSCIACVDEHGKAVVLNNAENESTTPSVVFFETEDNIVVGKYAKEVAAVHEDRVVSTVKRAMGDAAWKQTFFGTDYSPQAVSALILRKLVSDAAKVTGDEIHDVVITCPAYFGVNEKEATRQAGQIAGLNVLYVIPEPTAAALAYGLEQEEPQTVMVYDLGGGTFDVTVIAVQPDELRVVCTGGDHELGGKDWDDRVVSYLAQRFGEQNGSDADALLDDPETYQELLNTAERIKRGLTDRQSITETVSFGGDRERIEVTRATFDEITRDLLERTVEMTLGEVEKARAKGHGHLDKVLLVGGSTYMPQVRAALEQRFDCELVQFDPNQAVAKGAALYGYKCELEHEIRILLANGSESDAKSVDLAEVAPDRLQKAQEEIAERRGVALPRIGQLVGKKVINVTAKSFGLKAYNEDDREMLFTLVRAGDEVPATISDDFQTRGEGQRQVDLECFEYEPAEAQVEVSLGRLLGTAVLPFARALAQGSPLQITFDLTPDGLLRVHGKDLTTHGEIDAEFRTEAILSREEVQQSQEHQSRLQVA